MEKIIGNFLDQPVLAHAFIDCGYQNGGRVKIYLCPQAIPSRHFPGALAFWKQWPGGYRTQGEPSSRAAELAAFEEWQEQNLTSILAFEDSVYEVAAELPLWRYTKVETRELLDQS